MIGLRFLTSVGAKDALILLPTPRLLEEGSSGVERGVTHRPLSSSFFWFGV